uniref:GAS domain-containing protein n=1 Tax=Parastrongyloides trichosuri TaxID=131310 RepID=A0A0N4ZSA6_PARTI
MEKSLDSVDLPPKSLIHKSTLILNEESEEKSTPPIKKLIKPSLRKSKINGLHKEINKNKEIKNTIKENVLVKKNNIKKLDILAKKNERLQKKLDASEKKLKVVDEDRYKLEKEKELISTNWKRGKSVIYDEEKNIIELHKKLHRTKTAHSNQILKLLNKIQLLSLKSEIYVCSSTQTENKFLEGIKDFKDEEIQTAEDVNPNLIHTIMRNNDTKLMEIITKNEREKMQLQSDFKFNMAQLEQNLKKEQDMKLRKFKNEKDAYIEDICNNHSATISAVEKEKMDLHLALSEQISQLQVRLYELTEKLKEKNEYNEFLKKETTQISKKVEEVEKEKNRIEGLRKTEIISEDLLKKERNSVNHLKKQISLQKDIIDIVLGEFRKLELERDSLIIEFEKCIGASNALVGQKKSSINLKMIKTSNDLLKLKKEMKL